MYDNYYYNIAMKKSVMMIQIDIEDVLYVGILIAYDEVSKEVPIETFNSFPVYIKYNSTNSGNAYMKINPSNDFTGVIFQPKFNDTFKDNFYQFGNLPLKLYHNTY